MTLALALALAGCATWQPPAEFSDAALRGRAVTRDNQGLRVSAAVLSGEDSRSMLGIDLDHSQMQPVWVEVHNATPRPMWLLRTGTDPDYFSPLEVAWSAHTLLGGSANASIDRHFEKLGFRNPIPAGATHAGILFTNRERGTKLLNVDLLGQKTLVPFSLFLTVPRGRRRERCHGGAGPSSMFPRRRSWTTATWPSCAPRSSACHAAPRGPGQRRAIR